MATKKWSEIRRSKVPPEMEPVMAERRRALRDALELAALRAEQGVTQVELARRLGISQGNVSELEHRENVYLDTLREYIEALGGRLELTAVFPAQAEAKVAEPA
jgi:transcriptional regulator with XRE-family HTH domain